MQPDRKYPFSKKAWKLTFFLCLFASACLILFCLTLSFSSWKRQSDTLRDWYGSWDGVLNETNDLDITAVQKHPLINKTGEALIYGRFLETGEPVEIGSIDHEYISLGTFSFLSGRFPVAKDEVALETTTLDLLGKPYVLDQNITLTIDDQEEEFKICGILEPWRFRWTTGEKQPGFIVSESPQRKPVRQTCLIQMKDGLSHAVKEIQTETPLIQNIRLENRFDPFSKRNFVKSMLSLVCLCVSCLIFQFPALFFFLKEKRTLQIIQQLGKSRKDFFRSVCTVYGPIWLSVTALILFIFVILPLTWSISALGLWLLDTVIFLFSCRCLIRKLNGVIFSHDQDPVRKKKLQPGVKVMTMANLSLRFFRFHEIQLVVLVAGLAGLTVMTASSAAQAMVNLDLAEKSRLLPDFRLRWEEKADPLQAQKLKSEADIYFFDRLPLQTGNWTLEWTDNNNSPLRSLDSVESFRPAITVNDGSDEISVHSALFCPGNSPVRDAGGSELLENEEWKKGAAVIIYTPPMTIQTDPSGCKTLTPWSAWADANIENLERDNLLLENSIVPGQTIRLVSPDGQMKQLPVSGIVSEGINQERFTDNRQSQWNTAFTYPYTVCVSEAFFQEEPVNVMEFWADQDDNLLLETIMSVIRTDDSVYFGNQLTKNRDLFNWFHDKSVFDSCAAGICLLFVIILSWQTVFRTSELLKKFTESIRLAGGSRAFIMQFERKIYAFLFAGILTAAATGCIVTALVSLVNLPDLSLVNSIAAGLVNPDGTPEGLWNLIIFRNLEFSTFAIILTAGLLVFWMLVYSLKRKKRQERT